MTLAHVDNNAAGGISAASFFQQGGRICVRLYEDINFNQVHDLSESSIQRGAFLLDNTRFEITGTTGLTCVDNVPSGVVEIEAIVPDGYGVVANAHRRVEVVPGYEVRIEFALLPGYVSPTASKFEELMEPERQDTASIVIDASGDEQNLLNYSACFVLGLALFIGLSGVLFVKRLRRQ